MVSTLSEVTKPFLKKNVPQIKPGDTIKVHQVVREGNRERIQIFEGVVIAVKGAGISTTFKVRKISFGVGVERTYPLHSPRIIKIERVKSSTTRRAKLYYLRGLTGKAARLKNEKVDREVWEEKGAEAKIEEIEEAVAEDAEARAEEKAEEIETVEGVEPQALNDEVKADIAADESDEAVEQAETIGESSEEVAHNEASNEEKLQA